MYRGAVVKKIKAIIEQGGTSVLLFELYFLSSQLLTLFPWLTFKIASIDKCIGYGV